MASGTAGHGGHAAGGVLEAHRHQRCAAGNGGGGVDVRATEYINKVRAKNRAAHPDASPNVIPPPPMRAKYATR